MELDVVLVERLADDLMALGRNAAWKADAIGVAVRLAKQTMEMWHEFRSARRRMEYSAEGSPNG